MKTEKPDTLEKALKETMSHARAISYLLQEIDDKYGVTLHMSNIYKDNRHGYRADFVVRRGIEEIEKALGKTAETLSYMRDTKQLKYYGIEFTAYADSKTKVFVKAFKEPPKIQIVEDDNE